MPEVEQVLAVIREWVAKAENDLRNAAIALTVREHCPTDTICFHAQQCVEKYIKAVLVLQGIPFLKTHNIRVLVELMHPESQPALERAWQDRLTDYATSARYPGCGEIPLDQARKAVATARRVRQEIRRLLPRRAKTLPRPQ